MKGLKVKPSELDSYIKLKTPGMEEAVKGQFYEYYCYNELIQNNDNIKIIKANYVERQSCGNFIHSPEGKIIYYSHGLSIAEFDVLGIKENTIYWWEITKGKRIDKSGIKRKMVLLDKIFKRHIKKFCLIVPDDSKQQFDYDCRIIAEPNYENYFTAGYFKFNKKIKECISLNELNKISSDYDYIDDIIVNSYDFYYNKNSDKIINNCLIDRVYEINAIKELKFMYYDIKSGSSGIIEIIDKKIFMDGKYLKNLGKTKYEIISLLNRLKYIMQ
jgi:hypothetical protein